MSDVYNDEYRANVCVCTFRCVRITDTGLGYLSTMSSLRSLYLRWCCQVEHTDTHIFTHANTHIRTTTVSFHSIPCNLERYRRNISEERRMEFHFFYLLRIPIVMKLELRRSRCSVFVCSIFQSSPFALVYPQCSLCPL